MIASALRSFPRRTALVLGLLAGSAGLLAAQGTVVGRVTDQANGSALVGARIVAVGTSPTTLTNADGRYRLTGVPAGTAQIRASQIGYASSTKPVAVTAGAEATENFTLVLTPYSLDEVVVTATGDQAKREVGNAVSTVDVASLVQTAPIANMNDLLAARAPGVVVLPGATTGAGSRVRIRGNSSLSLSNNPIYVVDGIRINSQVNDLQNGVGGTGPGRFNDLNPEEIESIDVVRGPSAATLYGTDAANGVIVIKTKRGKAGRAVWNAYVERGYLKDLNTYPTAYRGWRTGTTGTTNSTNANTVQCLLSQVVTGACVQDSVSSFNLWDDPEATPLGTGSRNQAGLQVSGGSDAVRYFASGEWEQEVGVLQLSDFFGQRVMETRNIAEVPETLDKPNRLRRVSLRANVTANVNDKTTLDISTGFITSELRLPQIDNNANGIGSNGFGGPGFRDYMLVPAAGLPARNNLGWRQSTPDESFAFLNTQGINRSITSLSANYRATSWLSARAVVGLDFTSNANNELCKRDECTFVGTNRQGFKDSNRSTVFNYTGDMNATASYKVRGLTARTVAGLQYIKENNQLSWGFAQDLVPGSTTTSAGALQFAGEGTATSVTLGFFAEQQFGWKDRVYVTAAVRSDRNSAFGNQFDRVYYPKLSLSYVISDEPFFPRGTFLTSLRLRGAYGASGRQPGGNDAIPFLSPTTASLDNLDRPALVLSALGNPELKPERSQETELGFEASMFNGRLNAEFTYYNKNSQDALISRVVAPSLGSAATRFENIGEVRNRGFEATLNSSIIDGRQLGWDITVSGSYNRNKIVSLGGTPPSIGTTNSDIEGLPIQAWWVRQYTYDDANGDGLIALNELNVDTAATFLGPPLPIAELTGYTAFEMLGRKLRLSLSVDSKLGGYQLNGTERIRCENRLNCRGDVDPTAPLEEQARAMAVRVHSSRTQAGYIEKTNFLRFREASVTYTLPDRMASWFRASRLSLTGSARNLGIITNYTGIDPEGGYFGTNIGVQSDFQTPPPPTYFTFRLNVTF